MKRLASLAFALLSGAALGDLFTADFDTLVEGQAWNTEVVVGGIRFFDLERDLDPFSNFFVVEECTTGQLGGMSAPNVMGIGGYVPGEGVGFGRLKSFEITLAGGFVEMRSLELDLWTFNLNEPGNIIYLEGYKIGELVDSDSFSPGSWAINHERLILPEDDYDRFVLHAEGPIDNGVVFAVFDNVRLSALPVPEPSGLAAIAIGVALLARSRRRAAPG